MINLFVKKKGSGVGMRIKHMITCADFLKFCLLRILKRITPKLFVKVEKSLFNGGNSNMEEEPLAKWVMKNELHVNVN